MTLPASFPLSMSQVATELGLSLPLSLTHSWVLKLAQKSAAPISFSDLLGKTGRVDKRADSSTGNEMDWNNGSAPFFDGFISAVGWVNLGGGTAYLFTFSTLNWWRGNIFVKNNTTGVSAVIPPDPAQANHWVTTTSTPQITRGIASDIITILPST